ncbi:MAG: hypothetical protein ACRC16_22045 [Aeromonas salmonicida]
MAWPNSLEGDLLRQAHREIERTQTMRALKGPGESRTLNINDSVKIRLTAPGLEIYRNQWRPHGDGKSPLQDSEGWSSWQLWQVMQTFGGAHVALTEPPPFVEMKIEQD